MTALFINIVDSLINGFQNMNVSNGTTSNLNSIMDGQIYYDLYKGYNITCMNKSGISYLYNNFRNKWLPFRNLDKLQDKKIFFIDEYILSYEQISDLNLYRSIIEKLAFMEEWRIHPSFPGYEFSSLGRMKLKDGRISEREVNGNGYIIVFITNDCGECKQNRLHRIITEIFVNCDSELKHEVNHINGIRHDNRIVNLEWVTPSENMSDRKFINNTSSNNRTIYQYDEKGNFIKEWKSMSEIVDFYSVQGIEKSVDNNRLYKGFYWFRKQEELLEGEIFKELILPNNGGIIRISNKGRFLRDNNSVGIGTLNNECYLVTSKNNKQLKVHRLVLMAFNPIENHREMVVDHIDGNKSNNVLENLRWATVSDNSRYHYENNKVNIKYKTRSIIFKHIESGVEYEFESITLAENNSGFTRSQIRNVIEGKKQNISDTRGTFTIRYKFEVKKIEKDTSAIKCAVNQFDLNGNYVRTFESLVDAATSIGRDNSSGITSCCRGNISNSGGYIWKYVDNKNLNKSNKCKVVQLTMDLKYINHLKVQKKLKDKHLLYLLIY